LLWLIDFAATACSLFFFFIGSTLDLRTREVPNIVWAIYGPLGLILTITRLFLEPATIVATLLSVAFTIGVSFAFYYFGLFGGADAKALICLSMTLPIAPMILQPPMGYVLPFPITVLIVGYFCSGSVIIWLGLKNLMAYFRERSGIFAGLESEPWWKKVLVCLTGHRDSIGNLTTKVHLYPMEKVVEDTERPLRKFDLILNAEVDRDQVVSKFIESLKRVGSPDEVWVNPGIPLLFFMLIALIIALVVGDPIFSTIIVLASHKQV